MECLDELQPRARQRKRLIVKKSDQNHLLSLLKSGEPKTLAAWLNQHRKLVNFYFTVPDCEKLTPLIVCVLSNHLEMVQHLLARGADPDMVVKEKSNSFFQLPALAIAGLMKNYPMVELLIDHQASIKWKTPEKNSHYSWMKHFLFVAVWGNELSLTKIALDQELYPNYANQIFDFTESWQTRGIDLDILSLLIQRSNKLDIRFDYGQEQYTPLGIAILKGRHEIVELLIKRLTELNQNIFKPCVIQTELVPDEKYPTHNYKKINPVTLALLKSDVQMLNTLVNCGIGRAYIRQIAEFYITDNELNRMAKYDTASIANLFNNLLMIGFFCFQQRACSSKYFFRACGVSFSNAFVLDFKLNELQYTRNTNGCREAITTINELSTFCKVYKPYERMEWLLFFAQQRLRITPDHVMANQTANALLHHLPQEQQTLRMRCIHNLLGNGDQDPNQLIQHTPDNASEIRRFL